MLELLTIIVFIWLFVKVIGLIFRVAWGSAKLLASLLFALAIPALFGCLMFAGGLLLLIPLVILGIAFAILKAAL